MNTLEDWIRAHSREGDQTLVGVPPAALAALLQERDDLQKQLDASRSAGPKDAYDALDNALIMGPQTSLDSFPDAKAALRHLIGWELQIAADPRVNGGKARP